MTEVPPLVDTNVLVYFFDESEHDRCAKARRLLEEAWEQKRSLAVSTQSLTEFFLASTRKLKKPLSETAALQFIRDVCSHPSWMVIDVDAERIERATEIAARCNISFMDAQLVATALEKELMTIYTEDADFKKVPGLRVVNPFAE